MLWFAQNHRPMPWKGEKSPYLIWLSEIILQQTRVAQGLPYFERFRDQFPGVRDLADASEDEVLKCWEGLGYYSRARNLHATAKHIAYHCKGVFPDTYEGLLALKGVGPYTAAAIASFAYGLPHAVLDGNVYRVLARCFGVHVPVDAPESRRIFTALAQQALDPSDPGAFNQAIMDFGATCCMPQNPKCPECPMQDFCVAFRENRVADLPVKGKKMVRKNRFFHYLVMEAAEETYIRQRTGKDIWQHLYEFPMIEAPELRSWEELQQSPEWKQLPIPAGYILKRQSLPFRQQLTHQQVTAVFFEISLPEKSQMEAPDLNKIFIKNVKNFSFPKVINCYLQDNSLTLDLVF